jgi:hypothetical protein
MLWRRFLADFLGDGVVLAALSDFLLEVAEASFAFLDAEVDVVDFLVLAVRDFVFFLLDVEAVVELEFAGDILLLGSGVVAALDELRVRRVSPSLSLPDPLELESPSLCGSSPLASSGDVRWRLCDVRRGVTSLGSSSSTLRGRLEAACGGESLRSE